MYVQPVIVILVVAARACARAVRLVLVLLLVLVPVRRVARGRLRFSRFGETQAAPVLSARRASASEERNETNRAGASSGGDNENHDDRLNVHHIPLWRGPWSRSEEGRENAMGDPFG